MWILSHTLYYFLKFYSGIYCTSHQEGRMHFIQCSLHNSVGATDCLHVPHEDGRMHFIQCSVNIRTMCATIIPSQIG